jgi:hypothetical protein
MPARKKSRDFYCPDISKEYGINKFHYFNYTVIGKKCTPIAKTTRLFVYVIYSWFC